MVIKKLNAESELEQLLFHQLKWAKFPLPIREFKFHPERKWRSDLVWPEKLLICEIEGGVYNKGRHVRPQGFEKDCEKYNHATLLGYRLLRVTGSQIKSGKALQWIESALALEP